VEHRPPGRVITFRGKAAALLTMLVLHAGRPVAFEVLTGALWRGKPPRTAVTDLLAFAHWLRAAGIDVEEHGDGFVLRPDPAECDYLRFGELVAQANAASAAGLSLETVGLLQRGLQLWRGDRAARGVARHGALAELLEAVDEERMRAVECLAEARIGLGEADLAARELSVLLNRSPLRDRAWRLRMYAHHQVGEYAAMAASYQAAFKVFRSELGRAPSAQLTDLYRSLVLGG
jgi:DNA-binding SARP family transcriptional activator